MGNPGVKMPSEVVLAYDPRRTTNARAIADCAKLGHLGGDWAVLDVTWGMGAFWNIWRPPGLVGSDLNPEKSPSGKSVDFTDLPWSDRSWDAVVFDPPYRFVGSVTNTGGMDDRYGVESLTVDDRMELIYAGLAECARVARTRVLVKCQDQVVSGKKVWQTMLVARMMERELGWRLMDRLEVSSYRAQPKGRRQVHARQTTSSLLIFCR